MYYSGIAFRAAQMKKEQLQCLYNALHCTTQENKEMKPNKIYNNA